MGIQLKNGGENSKNSSFRNQSNTVAAKQELSQKQEEMRQKALAFEEMEARKNPQMAAEREQRLAQMRKEEEQRAQFKAEEEAKIKAERRVQEKKMDQTEALIAAIRAQVEKEKAAKEEANKQVEAKSSSANKSSSNNGEKKQQFRTISPEEMAKLEEKKRLKATGGGDTAISGGLGEGPTLSNPNGNGPTLSNPNAGQESLTGTGIQGGGLGIDITAGVQKPESGAEESTVALSTDAINAAMEKSKSAAEPHKPHTPSQVVGGASTIVVDDGSAAWTQGDASAQQTDAAWVESSAAAPQQVSPAGKAPTAKAENDFISVVPVRQKPVDGNDVQSAYNIDFDDGDDDDDVMSFGSYSQAGDAQKAAEEEARRKAEEEAARKAADEEARRRAEE
ncbi:MAG: hypothetical protein K2H34_02855, partial [Lachnospiraceae bacterium]|nr:hypothetical protein [Lachnospiraceae bacterium]